MRDLTKPGAAGRPPALPKGLAFDIADLLLVRSWAGLHNCRISIQLDHGGLALVDQGLSAGDRIITAGHYRVQPGGPVRVLDDEGRRTAVKPTADKLD